MNRAARLRHSRLLVDEYSNVNHNTGRPLVAFMTLSMTHAGYHDSGLDSMSFVPSAITIAVVWLETFVFTMDAPALAVRPTRASTVTRVQIPVLRVLVASDPKASDPTVSESPTKRTPPCPFMPMSWGLFPADASRGKKVTAKRAIAVHHVAKA